MHARLRGSKSILTLYQIIIKPDFPSWADKIAEPRPNMNIKVAAFTVSEKSINTVCFLLRECENSVSSIQFWLKTETILVVRAPSGGACPATG